MTADAMRKAIMLYFSVENIFGHRNGKGEDHDTWKENNEVHSVTDAQYGYDSSGAAGMC